MLKDYIERANILIEALPYIRRFYGETIVIKYGGSLMESDEIKPLFANDIVLLKYVGMNPVIIHGGGKEISKWMTKLGKETVFIDGLRVTDSETMEVTEMVLSGKINSEVVSLINSHGGKAVGLSGKDAKMLKVNKKSSKNNQNLGLVGDVLSVDVSLINNLTQKGYIPVISSVGATEDNETLNMNADYVASAIAGGLNALKLFFLTDVDGILRGSKLVRQLNEEQSTELLNSSEITGGMIPKLECALDALRAGVRQVHIINGMLGHSLLLELFTDIGIGTMLTKEPSVNQRTKC